MFNAIFCKQSISHIIKHKKILFNEKDKMLKGESYFAGLDINLFMKRQYCKSLCHKLNQISPHKMNEKNSLIEKILGKVGSTFMIETPFMCDYGFNIEIGDGFCSNHNLLILDPAKVTIGENVLVGPNCSFYTAEHPLNPIERKNGIESAKPITIGNNVWIGGNVVILAGVTIGDNSVIGAGSIVKHDIPQNTLAIGSPCKVIKKI